MSLRTAYGKVKGAQGTKGSKEAQVMREFKSRTLNSGSAKGPVVKNPRQAVAIALSEARRGKK